jgi:multidrug efflux pump subunit AcrA (membrane-fusion protein)
MQSNTMSRRLLRLGLGLVVILALVGGGVFYFLHDSHGGNKAGAHETENAESEAPIPVKFVHPRFDKSFAIVEKRPADVLAYYRDNLDSRVAGVIRWIKTDVGSVVKKGNLLVDVEVPEREARKKEMEAAVKRADAQVMQKKAAVDVATAEWEAAQAKKRAMQARHDSDIAYEKFREKQKNRYEALLRNRAIEIELVDEQEDRYMAAQQATIASAAAVMQAEAEEKAAKTKIEQAKADLLEAKEKLNVTNAELDHATAMVKFAQITAPFDGVIVERNTYANRGKVVQSADQGHPTPLLVIERQDIVTLVMRVPDVYAAYITPQTEAIFETPSLPGLKIHGKVTRYPTSLINPKKDRTLRVEIDLWNKSPQEFDAVKNDPKFIEDLKDGLPGYSNLPVVPKYEGKVAAGKKLMPGMYGDLTLLLRKFNNVYMLPSSAIVNQGGVNFIYVVQDGKAHLQPVKVEVDDGKLVKVDLANDKDEVIGELTGKETVIVSNTGELSEGQPVKPVPVLNWSEVTKGGDHNEKH